MIDQLIRHYGAAGVFVASAVEGELGVLVGGAMAHLGKLNPVGVAVAGWLGSFVSTEAFFHLGRSQREARMVSHVRRTRAFTTALKWIDRHPRAFCFFYRFIYGFRVAGPIGISLSEVSAHTFAVLNLFSAMLWGIGATLIGWYAGPSIGRFLHRWFSWDRLAVASVVIVLALLAWLAWRARRQPPDTEQSPTC